jgi:murein DD-endopeptidase MepM/ murein hydrolase activator NlpD
MKAVLLLILILLLIAVPAGLMLISRSPELAWTSSPSVLGTETPVSVQITNPHGLRRFIASLEQEGRRWSVHETSAPSRRLLFWRHREDPQAVAFRAGAKSAEGLKDGKAKLIVEAQSNDFLGRTSRLEQDVVITTQPLTVRADGLQHYISQGGSELVLFTVSGYWTEAGVRVGDYTFRSFPVPGKAAPDAAASERFSLFAFPWDMPANTVPVVYARNPTGAEATATFTHKVFPKRFRSRDLPLTDSFLQKVVPEIDPQGSGDLLHRFLRINGVMRQANNQALADLRLQTVEGFLWTEPFLQLSNSKVESLFADTRSYLYKGKKVDQQVHLGFDLSVTQRVEVAAANDGRVVFAGRLGIYGNCVVIDHGYGLQSIYAHLSEIGVKPGETVKRRQVIGRSGATGLAGGDHLHFSMQVDGVQVNPVEWWDGHWIQDRIQSKIPLGGSSQPVSAGR